MKNNFLPKSFFIEQKLKTIFLVLILLLSLTSSLLFFMYKKTNFEIKNLNHQRKEITTNNSKKDFEKFFSNKKEELNKQLNNLERKKYLNIFNYDLFFENINLFSDDSLKVEEINLKNKKMNMTIKIKNYKDLDTVNDLIKESNFDLSIKNIDYDELITVELKGKSNL